MEAFKKWAMQGTTILGIAGLIVTIIGYFNGSMTGSTAEAAIAGAITSMLLPQHTPVTTITGPVVAQQAPALVVNPPDQSAR